MEKDALLLAGTIAGFVAAVLSIMEKLLDLRQRFRPGEEPEESVYVSRRQPRASLVLGGLSGRGS
jgi:hypothetical protein